MAGKKSGDQAVKEESGRPVEEMLSEIEERIKKLEGADIPLEEAFVAYREGMQLIRECDASIGKIEKRVKQIAEDGSLEDFAED